MVNAIQSGVGDQLRYTPTQEAKKEGGFEPFGADGFTFFDAIDIINPLQHLPVIGPLYRELTGDTLDPFSRVAGGSLFFGPLGTAISSVNVAMEEVTGNDMGGHVIALFKGDETPAVETQIAQTASAANPDTLDPITAWAMSEINYRNSEATKQGLAPPLRSYSTMLANAAPISQQIARAIPLAEQTPVETPSVEAGAGLWALNEVKNNVPASPVTQDQLKRRANAYRSGSLQRPELPSPQSPSGPNTRTAAKPAPSGAIAPQDNWFSSTMIEALAKLRRSEEMPVTSDNQSLEKAALQ